MRQSLGAIDTPKRTGDLKRAFEAMDNNTKNNTRKSRHLIRKISKGLDEKDYQLAVQEERIKALEAQLATLQPRKRKKVKLSPNSKFVDIRAIQKAQIDAGDIDDSLSEGEQASESDSEASTLEGDCIVVAP